MKVAIVHLSVFIFISFKTHGQMASNQYELEMDQLLLNTNPEYYQKLKNILLEYQNILISEGILRNTTFKEMTALLNSNVDIPETSFDLAAKLSELKDDISEILISIEASKITQDFYNTKTSKDYVFHQKITKRVQNGIELNRSFIAHCLLKVYDENDYELPLTQLKFLRFLHPKTDLISYVYLGPPNTD
mgnify:FL=1